MLRAHLDQAPKWQTFLELPIFEGKIVSAFDALNDLIGHFL